MNSFIYKIIAFWVICFCVVSCSDNAENKKVYSQLRFDKSLLQTGDILFRCGDSWISKLVLHYEDNGLYSHSGIVVKRNDSLFVAQAAHTDDGVNQAYICSLNEFFDDELALTGAAYRLSGIDSIKQSVLNNKAIELVGRNIVFDDKLNTNDSTELYCTEFVWHIYKSIGIDLSDGKRVKVFIPNVVDDYGILPSHIYSNKRLEKVVGF